MSPPAALERILAALPPSDALALSAQLEPRHVTRGRRLDIRDEAIRAALAWLRENEVSAARPTKLAERLSRELRRYLSSSAWEKEKALGNLPLNGKIPMSGLHHLLHRIARMNDGAAIDWRQIYSISKGARTPIRL